MPAMNTVRLIPENHSEPVPAQRPLPFGTRPADWRPLTEEEIGILEQGGSRADSWNNIQVCDGFSARRVENCRFYGQIRIGAIPDSFLEYHDLRLPAGIYDSTITECDIGGQVAVHRVSYMARMIVEPQCILFSTHEIVTTNHAKFGNGIVTEHEDESVRIWLETANESGGRRVLPFDGLLPADAWIWSRFRSDADLMNRFTEMTDRHTRGGGFGRIGSGTVIKHCRIIKDVKTGQAAYIKGCNKLKNLTINSDRERPTQLGEGCELVNGIVGYGCRVFYGVKAVRFVLCDHSSLKYGARLLNSVLGSNSTISCCEVLNSLIFGAHEQHHNSSFLCASVLMGQSNMASAATVGSNHNSRSPDGEIIAGRGFWPGLSVSLKHNSRFAAFCLIAKGAYPAELDIQLPFCLVSNDEHAGELQLMPGYWFRYNMYALARNAAKTAKRDQRKQKHLQLEFDWLAPDTVDQMRTARRLLEDWAEHQYPGRGREILEQEDNPQLFADNHVEARERPVRVLHAGRGWRDYGRMIRFYAVRTLFAEGGQKAVQSALEQEPGISPDWVSIGGQLVCRPDLDSVLEQIRDQKISSWDAVHGAYRDMAQLYSRRRAEHAACLLAGQPEHAEERSHSLIGEAVQTASFILEGIKESRRKDYKSYFRNMTYDSPEERDAVTGRFEDNEFIQNAQKEYSEMMAWLSAGI